MSGLCFFDKNLLGGNVVFLEQRWIIKPKICHLVASKSDLPSNAIYDKFCFSSVSRGQRVTDHILFGTPGTLLDWILRHRVIDPKKIKMFVLDEADVMIALQGHQDQSIRIHKSVNYCFTARYIFHHLASNFLGSIFFRDCHFFALL